MAQTHSTFEIDALLRKVAKSQDGLVTVAQAERLASTDTPCCVGAMPVHLFRCSPV